MFQPFFIFSIYQLFAQELSIIKSEQYILERYYDAKDSILSSLIIFVLQEVKSIYV